MVPGRGWKIKADGQEIDAGTWNDVFIMLRLDAGKHNIEMVYVTPGFYDGALISVVSVIIFIIALAITLSHRRSRKLKEDEHDAGEQIPDEVNPVKHKKNDKDEDGN